MVVVVAVVVVLVALLSYDWVWSDEGGRANRAATVEISGNTCTGAYINGLVDVYMMYQRSNSISRLTHLFLFINDI